MPLAKAAWLDRPVSDLFPRPWRSGGDPEEDVPFTEWYSHLLTLALGAGEPN